MATSVDKPFIQIDGSYMEGGGQILRIATALSALLNKPVQIDKIRAGRPKPGLATQHLHGLLLAKDITQAELEGGEIGSTSIRFRPKKIQSGTYNVDTQTAGSVTLILQTAVPILLYAKSGISFLKLRGGTHVPFAPFLDFFTEVLPNYLPFLKTLETRCEQFGFYPKGGGRVTCQIPSLQCQPLHPINRTEFGHLINISGFVLISGRLPMSLSQDNARSARHYLQKQKLFPDQLVSGGDEQQKIRHLIRIDYQEEPYSSDGVAVMLMGNTNTGCRISSSMLAQRNDFLSDQHGLRAAKELAKQLQHRLVVDQHVQDQLIIYMALAAGQSRILTGEITTHTKTAIWLVEQLTEAKFQIKQENSTLNVIECHGIGYQIDQYYEL